MKKIVVFFFAFLSLLSINALALDKAEVSIITSADLNDEIIITPKGISTDVNWIIISLSDAEGNIVYKGQMRPEEKDFNIYMDSESRRPRNFRLELATFSHDGSKEILTSFFEYYNYCEIQTAMELAMSKTYSLEELAKVLSLNVSGAYKLINDNNLIVDEMNRLTIETETGPDLSGVNITVGNKTYLGEDIALGTMHRKQESFNEVFNKAIINVVLKSKHSVLLEKMIEEFPETLGIVNNEGEFLPETAWYTENKNTVIKNLAEHEYPNVENFLYYFKFYCYLEAVNNTHSSSVVEFLRTQNGKYVNLDFSDFDSKLTTSDKIDYFIELFMDADRLTPDRFVSAFNVSVTKAAGYVPPSNDVNETPSSNSSGNTGVSIRVPVEETHLDDKLNENIIFDDLKGYTWAEKEILDLYHKGILKGRSEGCFDPGANITREEFVAVIVRAFNLSGSRTTEYTDVVENAWYTEAVNIATSNGIVGGYDGRFGVGENITREDMAVILFRLAGIKQIDISAKTDRTITDIDEVSDYAREATESLYKAEIINGFGNGIFDGKAKASRAQVAKLVYTLIYR